MDGYETTLSRLRWHLAGLRVQAAMLRLSAGVKAGFRPDQPRTPRGQPEGGQWTKDPGSSAQVHQVSRRRAGGGQVRIGGRWHPITPAQEARLAQTRGAMQRAIQDVRRIDPNWKPPAQAYSTPEGLIAANRAIEREARRHIFESLGTRAEQREVDRIGRKWGCHRCGTKNSGTPSGSFIGDHQMPKSMGSPSRIYPIALSAAEVRVV